MGIMEYDPKVEWIPEKLNTVADAISRLWGDLNVISLLGHDRVAKGETVILLERYVF